jgi:2'-5' RNA ligase
MDDRLTSESEIYASFWARARHALAQGQAEVDPYLDDRENDHRRGMTLLIRPGATTRSSLALFLDELAAVAPEQYHYHPAQLHVTVLSLFSATPTWAPHFARMADYVAAVDAAVAKVTPFVIRFAGVTATPGAVMIQGYADTALNHLRDALRAALGQAGLGDGLDRRYRVRLAHMTAMRYRQAPAAPSAVLATLQRFRTTSFDVTSVETLDLVDNDWYMSPDRVRLIKRYSLAA